MLLQKFKCLIEGKNHVVLNSFPNGYLALQLRTPINPHRSFHSLRPLLGGVAVQQISISLLQAVVVSWNSDFLLLVELNFSTIEISPTTSF